MSGASLALLFAIVLLSRDPGALLHAELWGDDGWSWFPDAYRVGLRSFLIPVGGYLNSFQRLIGMLAQFFPFHWTATIFATFGLLVQITPPLFLMSARFSHVLPVSWVRLFLALIYLGLPNSFEIYVNLTNTQWHLAMLAFLVIVSAPASTRAGSAFDGCALVVSGLSGPFCLILLPVALWELAERRDRPRLLRAGIVLVTAVVQGAVMLLASVGRAHASLGADPLILARIVSLQIVMGAEIGYYSTVRVANLTLWRASLFPVLIAIVAMLLTVVALVRGSALLRKFCLFSSLLFGAALLSPSVAGARQWLAMTVPFNGNRYYTFPMLTWIGVLLTLACDRSSTALRAIGVFFLAIMLLWAVPHDWPYVYTYLPRHHFGTQARSFEAASPGTRMDFPLYPAGQMTLVKQSR